ncbi:MAG: NYN domain-containing protein, partial [Nocardioides sp.]|nr:NYN domain-containing protein [Nocardioides sp.]
NQAVDVMYLVSGDDDLTEAVEEVQGHGIPVILLAVPNADGRPHAVSRHLQREADGIETLNPEAIDASVIAVRAKPGPEPAPAVAAVQQPAAVAPGGATRPSPTLLAQRRPAPRPVEAVPSARAPSAHLVYSSATGQSSPGDGPEPIVTPDLVDEVCASVLSTWLSGASQDQIAALRAARPLIPGELDRALLTDLSGRINVYYVEEETRRLLRERFWVQLERIAG